MMKKILTTLLFLPIFVYSYSQKPIFTDFTYYTPKKDTLFLQKNSMDAKMIREIWDKDTLINEPIPVFIQVPSIIDLKYKREEKDWKGF
jgi:hypothetical protein